MAVPDPTAAHPGRDGRGRWLGTRAARNAFRTDPLSSLEAALHDAQSRQGQVDALWFAPGRLLVVDPAAAITAIGGPPGAAATSLLYELTRNPDWADRLHTELGALDPDSFHADPTGTAPVTHRFVKEVLRMWSPPLLLARVRQTDIDVGDHTLRRGQPYLLSAYLIHRSEQHWAKADDFDPDRWLPDAPHGPKARSHYVPFGWAPKACTGAELGTNLLMILAHLFCTRYQIRVSEPEKIRMGYFFAAVPEPFTGRIVRRPGPPG